MSKFKVGDRVVHETGGPGEVVEFWNPGTSENGYMVKLDSGRQGGGANGEWFVFESYLTLEGASKEEEPQFKVNERVQLRGRLGTVVQVCDGFTEVNFDTRGLVNLNPTNSRRLNRVTDVEDCVLKKTGFKPKFKIGDRVVHITEGPGEVVEFSFIESIFVYRYEIKLDSGVQGGGINRGWLTYEPQLTLEGLRDQEATSEDTLKDPGTYTFGVYECELCRCSLMGCPECTKESVKVRFVLGPSSQSNINIMTRVGDIRVPEYTTTAVFKLQDGTYLKMPEPQEVNLHPIRVTESSDFYFVTEANITKGIIYLNSPFKGKRLEWVAHQEGLAWLHDMRYVLREQKAQLVSICNWRYKKTQEVIEEPYNYYCPSRNKLKGRWPTSRTP